MRPAAVVATLLALSSLAAALPAALPAQQLPFAPGARIRYRLAGSAQRQQATLLERTADSIVVGWPNAAPQRLAIASITSVEVGHGRSRLRGAGKGALWGAAIGAGVISAYYVDAGAPRDGAEYWGAMALAGGLAGAMYGAPIGLLIGSERWDRVPLRPDRVGLRPATHGVGLAVAWTR